MADVTRGKTFAADGTVENTGLHSLVDDATVTNIVQADIAASSGLAVRTSSTPSDTDSLWVDTSTTPPTTKVYDGSAWVEIPTMPSADVHGDLIYHNGTRWTRLAAGTSGQVLQTQGAGANPQWINEAAAVLTTQGDVLYEGASGLARLAAGTSGQFLKTQGAGANPTWDDATANFKIGSFTRDMTAATGDVSYTGVGFQPTHIIFFGVRDGKATSSVGFDDGTNAFTVRNDDLAAAGVFSAIGTRSVGLTDGSGKVQDAFVKTFDADGFTLTWTKTGSPAAGTGTVYYLAIK